MKNNNKKTTNTILILTTISTILTLIILTTINTNTTTAGQSETAVSQVEVGNTFPEINTTIDGEVESIDLIAGTNTSINCTAIITDYNGENDIWNVNATFFDSNSTYSGGSPNDNNNHYTIENCSLDTSYGDANQVLAACTFNVTYYVNNNTWICEVFAEDLFGFTGIDNDSVDINDLISLEIPSEIHYGQVDAFTVSDENMTPVKNTGNVQIDLNLDGWAGQDGDGNAMICTGGSTGVIPLEYEKYNINTSIPGVLNITTFNNDTLYVNLTDTAALAPANIPQRQNDSDPALDDFNNTYWRIYIPAGVAGTCEGNVTFAAVAG